MKIIVIFIGLVLGLLCIGIGIVIGYFAIKKSSNDNDSYKYAKLTQPENPDEYKTYIDSIQASNIEENLRNMSSRAHMAGLPEDLESAEFIEKRWIDDGLTVFKTKYDVLLSYPSNVTRNLVLLKDINGEIVFKTNGTEEVYDPQQAKTVDPFLAYTPGGIVNSTRLYYANYGELADLQQLADHVGLENLKGSIIIMRYGSIFRGDKVMHAQKFGAIGAILYNDPYDYAPFGITADKTYNQTWFMPPSGVQRGSSYTMNGDPLTPVYPSKDYMFRVNAETVNFIPKICAQPIGYGEALVFLQQMTGDEVNSTWRGSLPNVTYRYGGLLISNQLIEINSYNTDQRKDTYNVIGIMKGDIEPDRYIVIGNHRDAWSLGVMDPTSGTAAMLEVTRALGQMYRNGFRPRRSLMFCSWGAEEYGLIGSVEYVQEYVKVLGARIVSYLNVDIAVQGNYTIRISTAPMLFDAIVRAGKMVPSAYDPPGTTVYDKWTMTKWNNVTNEPDFGFGLGSGSDFYGFDQLAGSSNMDARYIYNAKEQGYVDSYPLYHTSYEAFSTMKRFVDPDFTAHRTLTQFWGVLALILSQSPVLPLNVTRYTRALHQAVDSLPISNPSLLNPLRKAIDNYDVAAKKFMERALSMDVRNPYEIRFYNDQLLQLERSFINPLGQGGDFSDLKHVVYAPSQDNQYASDGFPSILDAIATGNETEISNQVAIMTFFVCSASSTLKDFDEFIDECIPS